MASSPDTEITLGTGKLLFLFFGLVGICALFFGLGYSLGRKADPGLSASGVSASPQITPGGSKPTGSASTQPMGFYKAVEQKDANAELAPAADQTASGDKTEQDIKSATSTAASTQNSSDTTTLPTSSYFVQVAAVSKQDDAQALVDALKKKQYAALVANSAATDKLFRVQVGPFSDIKDAETTRAKLISDGYNPILKK